MARLARGLANLKESMLSGSPFPRLHAKAAETKGLLKPVAAALLHFQDQDPSKGPELKEMVHALETSHAIDNLVGQMTSFKPLPRQATLLAELVSKLNVSTTKLCHFFHPQGMFLFNFVPKNHYLFHLAMLGQHMSPRLAWCYQGEDLMNKVKVLAQGSFRGTPPRILGNKVMGKYMVGLNHALSSC